MERNERLLKAINYLKYQFDISADKDIALKIGIDSTNLSKAIKGDSKYLTDSLFNKITTLAPDKIDLTWLLTGQGEMLKNTSNGHSITGNKNTQVNARNVQGAVITGGQVYGSVESGNNVLGESEATYLSELNDLKSNLDLKDKEIDLLKQQIVELKKTIERQDKIIDRYEKMQ